MVWCQIGVCGQILRMFTRITVLRVWIWVSLRVLILNRRQVPWPGNIKYLWWLFPNYTHPVSWVLTFVLVKYGCGHEPLHLMEMCPVLQVYWNRQKIDQCCLRISHVRLTDLDVHMWCFLCQAIWCISQGPWRCIEQCPRQNLLRGESGRYSCKLHSWSEQTSGNDLWVCL